MFLRNVTRIESKARPHMQRSWIRSKPPSPRRLGFGESDWSRSSREEP
jgi:hypothetical protein